MKTCRLRLHKRWLWWVIQLRIQMITASAVKRTPELITWLAQNQFVWITKDDDARKRHIGHIGQAGVSVVWVRGLDGRKNIVSIKQVHLMLTVKLEELIEELRASTRPLHFMVYLSGKRTALKPLQAEAIQQGKPLRARGNR